jgi:hypothetical protein
MRCDLLEQSKVQLEVMLVYSVNIQWTFSEHSVNIQWTFSKGAGRHAVRSAGAVQSAAGGDAWSLFMLVLFVLFKRVELGPPLSFINLLKNM